MQALAKRPVSMMGVSAPSTLILPSPELGALLGDLTLFIATELYDYQALLQQATDDGRVEDWYESVLMNAFSVESILGLVRASLAYRTGLGLKHRGPTEGVSACLAQSPGALAYFFLLLRREVASSVANTSASIASSAHFLSVPAVSWLDG